MPCRVRSVFPVLLRVTVFFAGLALPASALAQTEQASAEVSPPIPETSAESPRWANRGHWNFGLHLGYGVENAIPRNISHVNMLIFQPQLGLIVKDFRSGPLRRFEIIN